MRTFLNFSTLSCVLILCTTACNKESIDTSATPIDPNLVKNQLDLSMKNWNDRLTTIATIKSYKEVDVLDTEAKRTALIDELVLPSAIAAYGDILDAQTVHLEPLSILFANNADATSALKAAIAKQITLGDKVMEITWSKNEQPFVTKCIVNKTGIVWDNVLHGVYMGEAAIESTNSERINSNTSVRNYEWSQSVNWIWGAKRGQMGYKMGIHHTNSIVTSTTVDAYAGMNSGTSFKQSVVLFPQGTQGTARIALGLATPTTALQFDESAFSVNGTGTKVFNTMKVLYPW